MIYFKYVKIALKSFTQYRLSMWLSIIGQFFATFFSFIGTFLLFERFGTIRGWTFGEVAVCFGVVGTSFAITECFTRGFNMFEYTIVKGEFDRVLLRPRGTILQVFGSDLDIVRAGLLIPDLVILILAVSWLETELTIMKIVTLILMVISGTTIFTGIFMLGAAVCFFTVQGLEVLNIFTYGGREMSQYPLNIYNKWLMRFFTFIIPFGCFNYLPLMYLTGRVGENAFLYMLSPLIGIIFIIPCIFVWRFGVKHYLSTGS